MIRICTHSDFQSIYTIINDAARAYEGVIPSDRWHSPYMSEEELQSEIKKCVLFWGYEDDDCRLIGVMGIQDVKDVTLIRHAYVETASRGKGIGGMLLQFLLEQTERPILIGTWADAIWAIRFYQKYGFQQVDTQTKNLLLQKYWTIPERQVETSVVLADPKWLALNDLMRQQGCDNPTDV